MKKYRYGLPIFIFLIILPLILFAEDLADEAKTHQIASFIEGKINSGGYNGCRARVLQPGLIQCDLGFPLGTNSSTVRENVNGVAELFGQIGLASTIYFTGYVGNLKVCEYKYDPFSRSIIKKK